MSRFSRKLKVSGADLCRFTNSPITRVKWRSTCGGAPQALIPRGVIVGRLAELAEYKYDGLSALEAIVASSPYGSLHQAVASLTIFTHPLTVDRLGPANLFRTVRNAARRGEIIDTPDGPVMFDDNKSPTDAFMWANTWTKRGRDLQFNHVYQASDAVAHYTNLRNICVSPSFLAKLTDTHEEIIDLLRHRVYDLYGYTGPEELTPEIPATYSRLYWANPLPPVENPIGVIAARLDRRKKDRTAVSAKSLGWVGG